MILHTTEVIPLSAYRLFLRFNNGDAGEVATQVGATLLEVLERSFPYVDEFLNGMHK
jgi:hypothetical protein